MENIHRFKALGLLALPIVALVVALMVFSLGHSSTDTASATTPGAPQMSLGASGAVVCVPDKCFADAGGTAFLITASVDAYADVDADSDLAMNEDGDAGKAPGGVDAGDGVNQDGDLVAPAVGPPEDPNAAIPMGGECSNGIDEDSDTVPDDGCDIFDEDPAGYSALGASILYGGLAYSPRASCPLELIHPDFAGPSCVRSFGGAFQPQWGGGTEGTPSVDPDQNPFTVPGNRFITTQLKGVVIETDVSCPGPGQFKVTMTATPGDPFGAVIIDETGAANNVTTVAQGADLDGDTTDDVSVVADTLLINCVVPPTPTAAPETLKSNVAGCIVAKIDPTPAECKAEAVAPGGTQAPENEVVIGGMADFAQDMDGGGLAGWRAVALQVSAGGMLVKGDVNIQALDPSANCIALPPTCQATANQDAGPEDEAAGPVLYSVTVSCTEAVGDFTVSVTADFLREDGSPVPAEKSAGNTADVVVTCNPINPAIQKLDLSPFGLGDLPGDALSNLWLTRQGSKIPPVACAAGTDTAVFEEVITLPITSLDPKGIEPSQILGAFELEVRYDPKLICVNIEPGTAADLMICMIDDKDEGVLVEGIARIGCVTKGKDSTPVDTTTDAGRQLAEIIVRPQPELYSQLNANQDNGIVVQLLDQDCALSDIQGHPIKIFSCEDADITVRYLEGDVEPDCVVDALDQQAIAFRWGAEKGSLLYGVRYDLEPSGFPAGGIEGDGDVDILDLQFVFGRHGSDCVVPWPLQVPVNAKA